MRVFYTDYENKKTQKIVIDAFEALREQGILVDEYDALEEYFEIPDSGLPLPPKRPKKK